MFASLAFSSALLLLLLLSVPAESSFRSVPQSTQRASDLKLSFAGSIPYEGLAYNYSSANNAAFSLSYDVDFFDTLSEADFDHLMSAYSGWSKSPSSVKYKPGVRYTLVDFLPLSLQATSSLRFTPQSQVVSLPSFGSNPSKAAKQVAQFLVNCWGFAYDVVQSSLEYHPHLRFTLGSPTSAWNVFTSPSSFTVIQSGDVKDAAIRNKALRPGDVLLIYHQNRGEEVYLDHAAVYLDADLYYERAGTGLDVPFRVNTYAGLSASWMPFVFEYKWVRANGGGGALPEPAVAFRLDNEVSLEEVSEDLKLLKEEVKVMFAVTPELGSDGELEKQTYCISLQFDDFVYDELGRAKLPDMAFDEEKLKVVVPDEIYA